MRLCLVTVALNRAAAGSTEPNFKNKASTDARHYKRDGGARNYSSRK